MAKKESKTAGAGGKRGEAAKKTGSRKQPSRGEKTMSTEDTGTATLPFTHEQIAERAREIWEERGRRQGEDERNWREAERQLKEEYGVE